MWRVRAVSGSTAAARISELTLVVFDATSSELARYPHPMPRHIIHSDVSADPESESEALSIAPDVEEPEAEPEEEEEEGEGEVEVDVEEEDEDGDEREEVDGGDEMEEEGEEADEPEEEEEDEEPADDGDGDAVQEVRSATHSPPETAVGQLTSIFWFKQSDLDELSSPSISPPPAPTVPPRSSRLKITLKLPAQTQKPPRVRRAANKDKDFKESDVESEDDDDDDEHLRVGEGKRPLTTRQAVLASVVGSSHVSLGAFES
jgi:Ino eighty subunit 2